MQIKRVNIFGARISAISLKEAVTLIEEKIAKKQAGYICICPVSSVITATDDEEFKQIVNSSFLSTPDGMPVVWYIKAKGFDNVTRVCGFDLMKELFCVSQKKGYKHYFYGGTDDTLLKFKENVLGDFPQLKICGMCSSSFRTHAKDEDEKIIADINRNSPDFVWIGNGSPKQEKWMAQNVHNLNNAIFIGVGVVFGFYAGVVKRAPGWLQQCGFEWLFRLLCEPRRLWKRYLYGNTKFVWLGLREILTKR